MRRQTGKDLRRQTDVAKRRHEGVFGEIYERGRDLAGADGAERRDRRVDRVSGARRRRTRAVLGPGARRRGCVARAKSRRLSGVAPPRHYRAADAPLRLRPVFARPQRGQGEAGAGGAGCDAAPPDRRGRCALPRAQRVRGGDGRPARRDRAFVRAVAPGVAARARDGDAAARSRRRRATGGAADRRGHGLRAHQLRPRRRQDLGADDRQRARSGPEARACAARADGSRRPEMPDRRGAGAR